MKVYVAGKISGLERHHAIYMFERAKDMLKAQGYEPFVPTVLPAYDDVAHEDYLHICYAMIDVCDAIYMLSNWQQSKGARIELQYASDWKKKTVFPLEESYFYRFLHLCRRRVGIKNE